MSQAPFLTTERLELWKPQASDFAGLHALTTNPDVRAFLGPDPPSELASGHRFLRNAGSWTLYGYGTFMVRLKNQPQIAGNCGVFHSWRGFGQGLDDVPEAGWIIEAGHWGKGLAGEAMRAILAWFDREHGARRVACMIEQGHAASMRIAEKLGFAPYDRHEPDEGAPLILLERLGP